MYICIDRAVSDARASLPLCPGAHSCHDCNIPAEGPLQVPFTSRHRSPSLSQLLLESSCSLWNAPAPCQPWGLCGAKAILQSQAQGKRSLSSKVRRLSALL